MNRNLLKHYTALLLAAVMLIGVFSTPILAATVIDIGVDGLSVTYEGGTWSSPGQGKVNGSVETDVASGCSGDSYTQKSGDLTITNTSGDAGTLKFKVTGVQIDGGSVKINNEDVTGDKDFATKLDAGESLTVNIASNPDGEGTTKVSLEDITFDPPKDVEITFTPAQHGSYSINDTPITENTVYNTQSTVPFKAVAAAASGYKFAGWIEAGKPNDIISGEASVEKLYFDNDMTVTAHFVSTATPVFDVAGKYYYNLGDAVNYAQANSKNRITLVSNGTLTAGSYTIPNGITLLIPFDDAQTMYGAVPAITYNAYTGPSAYRLLTMANGASITVENGGAIELGGKLSSKGQMGGNNGTPTGPDGRINMNSGSAITLKNGANLYCWGYIYGSGSVVAESGSTVYEAFQIKDWRGGTATSNIYDYAFIFNQYYIQNIEVPLTIHAGAVEKLYSSVNASGSAYPMGATFIGRANDGGMFTLTNGYIVKDYIEDTDRLSIKSYGDVAVSPMTLTGLPFIGSISTANYVLPITSNISIELCSGKGVINQDIELLPGVEIIIGRDAELEISPGKRVYVYDNDDWKNFSGTARLYVIGYSVANGTEAKRTAASLVDAKLDINGVLTVKGDLFTSSGGADIISSAGTAGDKGVINFVKAPTEASTLYEMLDNKTKTTVPFTAPKLHNGVGHAVAKDYIDVSINTDLWKYNKAGEHWYRYTVKFVDESNNNLRTSYYCEDDDKILFATPGGAFVKSGDAKVVANGTNVTVSAVKADSVIELSDKTYTVTWKNGDTVLETDNTIVGFKPTYDGAEPTKDSTDEFDYTFAGWTTEADPTSIVPMADLPSVSEDITYYAAFSEAKRLYDITWIVNGTTVTTQVEYGTLPVYPNGTNGTPDGWSEGAFDYVFTGWDNEPVNVTGEATYEAVFEAVICDKELTIEVEFDDADTVDRTFFFEVRSADGQTLVVVVPVTVAAGQTKGSIIVTGLRDSSYKVTEQDGWSWDHTVSTSVGSNVDFSASKKAESSFTQTKDPERWLSGEAHQTIQPQ